MAFRAIFQKLRGRLTIKGELDSQRGRMAKFSEKAIFLRVTMFFCKRVISVATVL